MMRHGKTDWNALHKLQGQTDIPLNEEGRQMAREAARQCHDIPFDLCYCSPLQRARETAEILLQNREIPILIDERLTEMSFGIYEGQTVDHEDSAHPLTKLFSNPPEYIPLEGESFAALFERTGSFLAEVVKPLLQQNKNVLIIGHGTMNASIYCRLHGLSLEHFWDGGLDNCKLISLPVAPLL